MPNMRLAAVAVCGTNEDIVICSMDKAEGLQPREVQPCGMGMHISACLDLLHAYC